MYKIPKGNVEVIIYEKLPAKILALVWTWRRLAAEVGTFKITGGQGSHNKPIGCGASGAYAAGPDDERSSGLHAPAECFLRKEHHVPIR
jgi:hypothetical protein